MNCFSLNADCNSKECDFLDGGIMKMLTVLYTHFTLVLKITFICCNKIVFIYSRKCSLKTFTFVIIILTQFI